MSTRLACGSLVVLACAGAWSNAAAVTAAVRSEAWDVRVTVDYVDAKGAFVRGERVMNVQLAAGKCVKGVVRDEEAVAGGKSTVTQELCLAKKGDLTELTGWVFANKRIASTRYDSKAAQAQRMALNYGTPISATTDGARMTYQLGSYRIQATRRKSA